MAKENLHRRKSVLLPAAFVSTTDSAVTIVVPEVVGKNSSHTGGRGGQRFTSKHTNAFRKSVTAGLASFPCPAWAHVGAWRLEVVGVWPTQNHDVGFVAPRGDADAAIPQALDALQYAGILDDDARVVEVRAWNLYRKGVRATVMRLERVAERCGVLATRDMDIAHLLPLVPPAVEPPTKPSKQRPTLYQSIPVDSRVRGRSAQMGRVVGPGREGFVCVLWDGAKHQLQVRADALEVVT